MKKFVVLSVLMLIVIVLAYETQVNFLDYEFIIYRVTVNGRTATVLLQFDELKKGGYEVTYSVKFNIEDEFDYEAFALPYIYTMLSYAYNPAFLQFLQMVDLERPSTLSFYGIKIVYEKDEKVGNYTGRRFSFYSNDQKLFSWVASKDIDLILKIEVPSEEYVAELMDFRKR
ncbi:hypothetical protein AS159_08680 [Thermotoga sp. Ku-13t]|uniref:hypothetical protein n=1 Tax=Thermotoga sp. Ku-13t TaxID=1755813 RepID=UPI0013EBDF63|nr:hypothetical protein [Thermotoga sp. Ku-13t]KAF2957718.1 hypothetical protein AS159_08680 [Thermotoga sp. Ku-13t]